MENIQRLIIIPSPLAPIKSEVCRKCRGDGHARINLGTGFLISNQMKTKLPKVIGKLNFDTGEIAYTKDYKRARLFRAVVLIALLIAMFWSVFSALWLIITGDANTIEEQVLCVFVMCACSVLALLICKYFEP